MSTSPTAPEPAPAPITNRLAVFLEMIKFQHTVFALPFALIGLILASRATGLGLFPGWTIASWVVAACVFARTAAMSFNRWADADIDARNPRTATRAIPARLLSRRYVLITALVSASLFIFSAFMLNRVAFALSPVALAVLFGYSWCKRFTSAAHLVLGLALGIAPIGAWVAVRGEVFAPVPLLLGLSVLLWTTGFDIVYACQDVEVDRAEGLYSLPARLGAGHALTVSRALHILTILCLATAGYCAHLSYAYYSGVALVAALLLAEHLVVQAGDTRRINLAFFTINSWVGVVLLAATAADLLLTQ